MAVHDATHRGTLADEPHGHVADAKLMEATCGRPF